jgi:hypothetical protein
MPAPYAAGRGPVSDAPPPAAGAQGPRLDTKEAKMVPGAWVFLRNARFRPEVETPTMPRYWVARVYAQVMPRGTGAAAARGGGRGGRGGGGGGRGGGPLVQSPVGGAHNVFEEPGNRYFRLQWHRETASGSGMFLPHQEMFVEHESLLQLIEPPPLFDALLQVWRRDRDGAPPPPPLVFAGDEGLMASIVIEGVLPTHDPHAPAVLAEATAARLAAAAAARQAGGGGRARGGGGGGRRRVVPGSFAFMHNAAYVPGRVETVAVPQYWVVRLQSVVAKPDAALAAKLQGVDGRPGSLPPLVRVQWLAETGDGSRLYKATRRVFTEDLRKCSPLDDDAVKFEGDLSAWRVMRFDAGLEFVDPREPITPSTTTAARAVITAASAATAAAVAAAAAAAAAARK